MNILKHCTERLQKVRKIDNISHQFIVLDLAVNTRQVDFHGNRRSLPRIIGE